MPDFKTQEISEFRENELQDPVSSWEVTGRCPGFQGFLVSEEASIFWCGWINFSHDRMYICLFNIIDLFINIYIHKHIIICIYIYIILCTRLHIYIYSIYSTHLSYFPSEWSYCLVVEDPIFRQGASTGTVDVQPLQIWQYKLPRLIAKLVNITPTTVVYGTCLTLYSVSVLTHPRIFSSALVSHLFRSR